MKIFDGITKFFKSIGNGITSVGKQIGGGITSVGKTASNGFGSILGKLKDIFNKIKTIFNCLTAFFNFIGEIFKYSVSFSIWFFTKFVPWVSQYLECMFYKIISLPKCFLWYFLDTASYILYLPIRFGLWLIDATLNVGIQKIEYDIWCFLEDIDKFIHNTPNLNNGDENDDHSLGTGIHIIHFPDSVTERCYNCRVSSFPKIPSTKNLTDKYKKLRDCDKRQGDNNNCKKCDASSYFE